VGARSGDRLKVMIKLADEGWTHEEIAKHIGGITRSGISNALRKAGKGPGKGRRRGRPGNTSPRDRFFAKVDKDGPMCSKQLDADLVAQGSTGSPIKSPYWQILRDCEAMMSRVGGRFGLTPADRSSLTIRQDGPKLGGERLLS
jgi:hypothetical protein